LNEVDVRIDPRWPVIASPARKLSYRFACAEALWITDGDNRLAPLTRFVKRMADFSDDDETLAGAYGPPYVAQLPYVVETLLRDRDTRQATMTIWRPSPAPSKDIPCTIAMVFSLRNQSFYQRVLMRSSDVWLGIPYDVFSFTVMGLKTLCAYNAAAPDALRADPAGLTISLVSSHLYERDAAAARAVLASDPPPPIEPLPEHLVVEGRWDLLREALVAGREDDGRPAVWRVKP
jgi:thymidylate synthase